MIDTIEQLNKKFDNKFEYLKLLEVVYDREVSVCTITLLYPFYISEISNEDKKEIIDFYQEFLSLKGILKIKFKKSFLDEVLIVEEVVEFFKSNQKGLLPYMEKSNIKSTQNGLNVNITLTLNQDVLALIDDFELSKELKNYIEQRFITNANVEILENEEILPEEIVAEDILPQAKKARRYAVKVEKKLIGSDIIPQPEYIGDNTNPKDSVILSGFISNKNLKTYVQKKGKRAGQERNLFTFNLRDESGSIDCVYFCGKTHEKTMNGLEDMFLLLMVGDLRKGLNDKLTYYVRKISLASPITQTIIETECETEQAVYVHKKVVFPEIIPRRTQEMIFDNGTKYNDYIMNNKFVVFDIETTGLNPEECEITELGAVKIENGEISERFSSFAKPSSPIPEEVEQLTNITNDMVADAPRAEDVVYDFYEWSRDCIISGYNIVGFDMKFINKVADKIGLVFDNEIVDTLLIARKSIRLGNYKLGTVVKALGLTLKDAHRAYNDAYATAQVLMEFNKVGEK